MHDIDYLMKGKVPSYRLSEIIFGFIILIVEFNNQSSASN